jgi:ferredoxin
MAHVVTERCADCRYTYCIAECPVDCFWEVTAPRHMLLIDPDVCINCTKCVPLCPVNAIWPEEELPEAYASWKQVNAAEATKGKNLSSKDAFEPLPTARSLEEIQAEEKAKGLEIVEPSLASSG